jgi:two-component system response regulator
MTSSTEEVDSLDSYELGVNSYIVKLLDFEQFTQVVGQLG